MKKSLSVIISINLIILLILPLISSVDFNVKSEYNKEEAIIAELAGQFYSPPLKENIYFYRGHVRIAIEPEIAKINEKYYVYASLAGKNPGNYSIVIEDVEYRDAGKITTDDIVRNFTISDNLSVFSIHPGFVSTGDDFSITIDNLQEESIELSISEETLLGKETGLSYEEENYTIFPGTRDIEFTIDKKEISEATIKMLTFSSGEQEYKVPVSIFTDEESSGEILLSFDMAPKEIELTMPTNSNKTKLVYLYNTGTSALNNVKVTLDESLKPYVVLSQDSFGQILPQDNANFVMSIVSGGEQSLGGKIKVTTEDGLSDEMRVSLNFVADYESDEEEQQQDLSTTQTCEEIGGVVCINDEECDGDNVFAKNQFCCIGNCIKPIKSSWGKLIGWGIVIVLISGAVWFFIKYKKVKPKIDLLKAVRKPKK